ncbi:MAG: DinB family protein [Vicinamibacteria bacterium]
MRARRKHTDLALEHALLQIDEAYDSRSWHGTNLRGSLRGVSPHVAAWRPAPERHNIWELAVHAAYWKYAVRRRITGEKRGSFALAGSNWFRRPEAATAAAWKADLALLGSEHRQMRAVIAGLKATDLQKRTPPGPATVGFLVRGIAAHDLYHAGQIQILKRLCPY